MTFLSTLALAVGLLVVAPYFAHRLRRRRAEEQPFAAARLVPPAPPQARRRSRLEDRSLLLTRAAAVVALALLGATPFVRCSRLSLERAAGASIAMAIVVDDSMSMRADAGGRSRFVRALDAARELMASSREGDAVAVVLGGAPARVALAPTTDLGAARRALDALSQSDRATDLEGALGVARGLVAALPQVDRRVVVLSDLADGHPDGALLGGSADVATWIALPEIQGEKGDCGVVRADQRGATVHVTLACGPGHTAAGRDVVAEDASGKPLGRAAPSSGTNAEATVVLTSDVTTRADHVRLLGADAIAADDVAPVVTEGSRNAVAIVGNATDETVATGGAPIVEQALSALKLDVDSAPIPAVPDRLEDLHGYLGLMLDDPPGFTPEQRRTLGAFIEGGGVVLISLGAHAAAAPLGATLEPLFAHAVAWSPNTVPGANASTAIAGLAESAASLQDIAAERRATIAPEDIGAFQSLVQWTDGAPLIARRTLGRGEVWVVTLPFSIDESDLPLRPAFLSLLAEWVRTARERAAPERSEVGVPWKLVGVGNVEARGPTGPLFATYTDGAARLVPPLLGAYRIQIGGILETRVASLDPREVDLRPRKAAPSAGGRGPGERSAAVDLSGVVALAVLALVALEMALRIALPLRAGRRARVERSFPWRRGRAGVT